MANGQLDLVRLAKRIGLVLFVAAMIILAPSSCFLKRYRGINRLVEKATGPTGWQRVTPQMGVDDDGNATIPPKAASEARDDEDDYDESVPLEERLKVRFKRQLDATYIEADSPCLGLTGSQTPVNGTVLILVHGVKGVGAEWWPTIPTLTRLQPAAIFLFRWNATQVRDDILPSLITGINRIAFCFGGGRRVVLAHSAGGVLMSFAASRLAIEPTHPLEIYTVASPLAGTGYHSKIQEEDDDTRFFNDLGSRKEGYAEAAPNVVVTHLRTQYPGDQVMKPNVFGRAPNERGMGVKGAKEVDLPSTLTHDSSLLYVARELAAGRKF